MTVGVDYTDQPTVQRSTNPDGASLPRCASRYPGTNTIICCSNASSGNCSTGVPTSTMDETTNYVVTFSINEYYYNGSGSSVTNCGTFTISISGTSGTNSWTGDISFTDAHGNPTTGNLTISLVGNPFGTDDIWEASIDTDSGTGATNSFACGSAVSAGTSIATTPAGALWKNATPVLEDGGWAVAPPYFPRDEELGDVFGLNVNSVE